MNAAFSFPSFLTFGEIFSDWRDESLKGQNPVVVFSWREKSSLVFSCLPRLTPPMTVNTVRASQMISSVIRLWVIDGDVV